ncbi:MAG: C4-type zinc ribbon domain-containing protein [Bacteroidetes bacterium]|nr:C4-type zinc ribbon domain-containing protein [Bacteroidota bacterium]MCL1968295.1 C4-type zinc ribbon domain-containing protein [Bacteroidota bacterium]
MAKKKIVENQSAVAYNENITHLPENIPQEGVEEITIAKKLLSLYNLQQICSQIDKIRVVRGELPNEVRDLEDALAGMQTRIENHKEELEELKQKVIAQDAKMKESTVLIKRYEDQQNNVRNNREYESLSKEIEYQKLEIQVAEKHKIKFNTDIVTKIENIAECEEKRKEIAEVLEQKKSELTDIIAETKKEEQELIAKAEELKKNVDYRLLNAFERIRNNARNGLAIVQIERDACGGCFSTIPPQRQLDIRLHKKIIVCEACGRIFIDKQLVESQNN